MLLSNLEYIPLRLIRKFLLTEKLLLKIGQFLPYYQTNSNQINPTIILEQYSHYLAKKQIKPEALSILEIGVGATNSTGYLMALQNWGNIFLFEPYISLSIKEDDALLARLCPKDVIKTTIVQKVKRLNNLQTIPDNSIDLILSNSVLEHVDNLENLFIELKRILKPTGKMLHLVDYRDHFFKYPYHFLQFSKKTWHSYLNPGDLPVWRLREQLEIFQQIGFVVEMMEQHIDTAHFEKIKPYIANDYDLNDSLLGVTFAVLWIGFT
ncbi:methyltransferase domain-containing protein [Beggiatoa leptomitoformis]|uniref:Methyltransferase domain-containing protein n=1 Tax=Beggiatoa leptomitoformis TaxID=288004 RepID=A0A2N9YHD8_9GAMM|nr:methyltransferase domain-containing protein [Beggiatoa leptomitoformis]ALG67824.1 methyltransferase domain-containing protein [Beggiatoa leptomitoformis]AUI69920.1 methyltransferase domain-containing protein [Beggiatoa leptomitoformis]